MFKSCIFNSSIFLSVEEDLDLEDGQWEEIHVITGALKLFLRELPEPLFPFTFFERFIAAIREFNNILQYLVFIAFLKKTRSYLVIDTK